MSDNIKRIYTDGSLRNKTGGVGIVIKFNNGSNSNAIEISRSFQSDIANTSSAMEFLAIITALNYIQSKSDIVVYTDYKYIVDCMNDNSIEYWKTHNWKTGSSRNKRSVKHKDLWLAMMDSISKHRNVTFKWVKAHNGHLENTRCNQLARNAAKNVLVEPLIEIV